MFVLDTNTLIYFFKGRGRVAEQLLAHPPRDIGIPTVVLFGLEYGIGLSTSPEKRRGQRQRLLSVVTLLPFDARAAQNAARIRVTLEKAGTPVGSYDLLIAAIALANDAVLVTHNTREFMRVPGLEVADWFE